MLDIRDIEGKVVFSTPINKGCKRKYTLMQEDYISLVFSVEEPIYFRLGDSIYDGDFEVVDLIIPKYNEATAGYDYEARFDAYYWKWKNKKFFYAPEYGAREASWKLTANLSTHANIILRNLKHLGYTYKGKAFEFVIDSSVQDSSKFINYDNLNIIDALTRMAEEWGCEWWVTDNIIHFGRCEYGDPVDFILNENVEQMNRSDSKQTYATRIYAFGSQRNIPKNYRPVDSSITVNGIVQKRLMLPADTPYIDAFDKMRTEEAVEEIVIFDEVYPKRINKITEVEGKESSVKNEEIGLQEKIWTYLIKDKSFNFQEKYILQGEELRLTFHSGRLNGMDFAVSFKKGSFELVRNEDYGRLLPDDILKPNVGDEFILYGYDTSFVSDSLLPDAELELKKKALEYAEKKKIDPSTYECSMMSDYMENKGNPRTFEVGDRVRLINKAYFKDSRVSRIIGYEYLLDIPYDSPKYIVGETISYSHIGELKDEVKDLVYKEKIYQGSQSSVYVVGQYDSTKPTDRNVLSSIRSLNTFLRKDKEDSTEHLITFLAGLKLGAKYSLDKNGNAALNNIKSSVIESLKAKFHELENTKLNSSEGTINTLTALTLFVKNLADVQKLDVKETATILNAVIKGTLSSPKFVSGFLGEGFRIAKSSNGDWNLEIDNLTVRKVFQVFELLIQEVKHQGGVVIHSPAGGKITKVTDGGSYWKCEVEGADTFYKDDLVLCQKFTGKNIKRYWRLATSAGDGFVNLSKTDCEANSAIPEVDDEIATLGNKTNTARQSAYLISVVGADAPYTAYYSGINSYSLKGKEHTRIGNLEGVVSPAFGPLKGSGALLENAYIQGIVKLQNGKTVETVISETSSKLRTELKGNISKSKEETKGEINSSVSSVRNELNSTIAKAEEQFNTGINQTKTELSSNISSVKQELEGKINTDIQVSKESIAKQITQSQQEAEAAAKAYTDAQDKAKLTQAKSYADGKVATEQKRAIEDVNAKLTAAKKYADAADAKLKTEQQAYADGKVTATEEKLLQTANDNLAAAKAYAKAQDEALKVKTDAYADGKITAEEKRAIADANTKLAAAKKYAEAQDKLLKTQQEAYADGKVTESEKRAIADATNKVNAAKNELNSLVSKAQSTADNAKSAIDGLEIGRRNLLKNSNKGWKNSSYPTATLYFAEQLKNGERFSIRIYGRLNDNSNNNWSIYNSGGNLSVLTISRSSYNKIGGFYEGTGVWRTNKEVKNTHINIYGIPNSKLENSIDKVMMIRGNKPTDWTPAPEDFETQINEVQTSVTKEITKVRQDFQITEGQINGKITETTQLVNEAKKTNGETKKTLEQTTARINQFDITAKKFEGTLGEISKKQGEVESSITNLKVTANSLNASVNGFKETEKQIKATANKIEATHAGIVLEASEKSAQKAIDGIKPDIETTKSKLDIQEKTIQAQVSKTQDLSGRISSAEAKLEPNKIWLAVKDNTNKAISDMSTYTTKTIDAAKLDENKWFPVTITLTTNVPRYTIIASRTLHQFSNKPSWSTHGGGFSTYVKWEVSANGWGTQSTQRVIESADFAWVSDGKAPIGDIGQMSNSSNEYCYVRGGGVYTIRVYGKNNVTITLRTDKYTASSQSIEVKTAVSFPKIDLKMRPTQEEIVSSISIKPNTISILSKNISLAGQITFTALTSDVQNKINTTQNTANLATTKAINAQKATDTLKTSLKSLAYLDKVEKAKLGTTVIEGGFLKTDLLRANSIKAEKLDIESLEAVRIRTGNLEVLRGAKIGDYTIDNRGLSYGLVEKWGDSNHKADMTHLVPGEIRIQKQRGYSTAGDVSLVKVGLGDNSDPELFNSNPATGQNQRYGYTAGYFYRQMNASFDDIYYPAVQILSENVINRNVALYTKGTYFAEESMINNAKFIHTNKFNVLDISYGGIFVVNASKNSNLYLPRKSDIERFMRQYKLTELAYPIEIICDSYNNYFIYVKFMDGDSTKGMLNYNGSQWGSSVRKMARGDNLRLLLIYRNREYYAQLLSYAE